MTATGLEIWAVYENPTDYPGKWVARLFVDGKPTDKMHVAEDHNTLIRIMAMAGLVRLPRDASDDPVIVETWV
jgi:hypothetical protein